MPVLTVNPVSQGTYMEWETLVGSTRPAAVSDASDATYLQQFTASSPFPTKIRDSFFLDAGIHEVYLASVNTLSGFGRTSATTHNLGVYMRVGSTDGNPTERTWSELAINDHGGTLSKPGGGVSDWLPGDVQPETLQIVCVVHDSDGTQNSTFYKAWVEIDFNPAGGLLTLGAAAFLGPLIGAGLALSDMAKLMRAVQLRTCGRLRFRPDEAPSILAELRRPRPSVFLLGRTA